MNNSGKTVVAFIIDNLMQGGGTENQLIFLLRNLDRDRFEPHVFNLRSAMPDKELDVDCPVHFLDLKSLGSPSGIRGFFKLAGTFRKLKVDIVQVYFFDARVLGTLAARLAGVRRIVFTRREMGWWYSPLKVAVIKVLSRLSHHCLANAHAIKDFTNQTEGFPLDRITVVHNGIPPHTPRTDGTPLRRELGIPLDAPLVGIVANFRPVKRHDLFLKMAAEIKDTTAHFLLVGQGGLRPDLEKLAAELGLGGRVHFHHTVGDVAEVMQALDLGVLSSESEGLSNVLIEYGLAGVPALAFDVGGNGEVIQHGQTGFVVPFAETDQMAVAIDSLLEDRPTLAAFGEQAREYANAQFALPQMVAKTEGFYRKILS
jgi:glycosyltransferase involved in cell wall biosynthesis